MESQKDREHMRQLAMFHFIGGGLIALFSLLPIIHLVLVWHLSEGHPPGDPKAMPSFVATLFVVVACCSIVLGEILAACTIISGRMLARRRGRRFSMVVAALLCLWMPLGTVLGVFTLIVLSRESVRQLYDQPGFASHDYLQQDWRR